VRFLVASFLSCALPCANSAAEFSSDRESAQAWVEEERAALLRLCPRSRSVGSEQYLTQKQRNAQEEDLDGRVRACVWGERERDRRREGKTALSPAKKRGEKEGGWVGGEREREKGSARRPR
jgi:hypothetical protein